MEVNSGNVGILSVLGIKGINLIAYGLMEELENDK
jgi:hypothetical protein